jgi:adenylate cyclase
VGDAFMATANLLSPLDDPVHAAVAYALDIVTATQILRANWAVRIGIDFGSVSAGIMGSQIANSRAVREPASHRL